MASTLVAWRNDIAAGAISAIVTLPGCIASGLLAFAPLGPDYAAAGAAAALCGAIVAGVLSALLATSSFVVTTPRVGEALLLGSLTSVLLTIPAVAGDKDLIVTAMFLCVVMAGLWQSIFGLAGVAKIIKFTPHPVLVGFLNGVAVLIVLSQLKPYFFVSAMTSRLAMFDQPVTFAILIGTAALMLGFPVLARRLPAMPSLSKVPAILIGFGGGIAAYYVLKIINPGLDIGPTVGDVRVTFMSPFLDLDGAGEWKRLALIFWPIVPTSAVLAIIATLNTLLTIRTAQNVSDVTVSPVRDLLAQGVANSIAGFTGGVASAPSPISTMATFRAGGVTRIAPVASALFIGGLGVVFPSVLAGIPSVVLAGLLLATGVLLFDRGVFADVAAIRDGLSPGHGRRAFYDLAVVVIVMGVTVFYSVVAGVVAGVVLAGTIFIMNMSRPVVERVMMGGDIQSKRIRPVRDVELLRETGAQRAVLMLEGVLFFGNADDLSAKVKQMFRQSDFVALDLRDVSDVDVSGANILANLVTKSRQQKKHLLFCGVPEALDGIIKGVLPKGQDTDEWVQRDLDAALEWMEEKSLLLRADRRDQADVLTLADIDFLAGLDAGELERLHGVLDLREFSAGETICHEGDDGDRMWLLAKGSVSVRLISADSRENRRIASLSRGTTIGEMALVESSRRSATIVADEHVVCYELLKDRFTGLLSEQPAIATKLLANLSRELARRLRKTTQDLRSRN
jgi:sulfate permease, SulP family